MNIVGLVVVAVVIVVVVVFVVEDSVVLEILDASSVVYVEVVVFGGTVGVTVDIM